MPNTREKLIELLSHGRECPDGRNPFLEESCSTCPYVHAVDCGAEMLADHLIAHGVTIQKWIPVTERLPRHREWVLVWHTGYKTPKKAFYKDDLAPYLPIFRLDCDNGIHGEVTHWMPLPEAPKGD